MRGQHPDIGSDQHGASAHRLGDRVKAAAHLLHYGVGVPVRRIPAVLRALTGVEVSQGAISQDALRRSADTVGDAYRTLRTSVRASPVVHTDDTGWRVGGEPAFLMAFETEEATVYQVRARHRNEEVREVVPADYTGVMVTDRGRSYDAQALSEVRQQKCLAHVLRSISEVVKTKTGRGRSFGKRLSGLLREAMELREAYHRGEAVDFGVQAERLKRQVSYHLRDRPMADADNYRLQNELGWHDDRGSLVRFLDDPSIEPTNNRAERALRGAVIARKVSHCSKNEKGADAFSAFTSVIRTLERNGDDQSVVDRLCALFSGAPLHSPSRRTPPPSANQLRMCQAACRLKCMSSKVPEPIAAIIMVSKLSARIAATRPAKGHLNINGGTANRRIMTKRGPISNGIAQFPPLSDISHNWESSGSMGSPNEMMA